MSKTYCGKQFIFSGEESICGSRQMLNESIYDELQCPECYAQDRNKESNEPTPFEVLNASNMPLIRHKNTLINVNNVFSFTLSGDQITLNETGTASDGAMQFNDELEASLAFDKIMGGKSAAPTNRELKANKNKTKNHATQESDTFDSWDT